MYDIHCHLAFGVDDGSESLEESLEMIKIYKRVGYTGAIVTSHYDKGRFTVMGPTVREKIGIIKDVLKDEGIDFSLFPGNEVQIDGDTVSLLKKGDLNRLNDSRYVLCELPFFTKPNYAKDIFYELQLEGRVPIIAHPERYQYVRKNPNRIVDFINSGCLLQMNISSLSSKDSEETARYLLEKNFIQVVATDSHSSRWRNPNNSKEFGLLKDLVGENKYRELVEVNPEKIVKNDFIRVSPVEIDEQSEGSDKKKRRKFGFWRRV